MLETIWQFLQLHQISRLEQLLLSPTFLPLFLVTVPQVAHQPFQVKIQSLKEAKPVKPYS